MTINKKLSRRWLFGLAALVLLFPLSLYFVGRSVLNVPVRPSSIRLSATPQPDGSSFCPGELVGYRATFDVLEAPVAVTAHKGVFSEAVGGLVVRGVLGEAAVYPYFEPIHEERQSGYVLPLLMDDGKPFPPGRYAVYVVGESAGRESIGFQVPFTIPEGC